MFAYERKDNEVVVVLHKDASDTQQKTFKMFSYLANLGLEVRGLPTFTYKPKNQIDSLDAVQSLEQQQEPCLETVVKLYNNKKDNTSKINLEDYKDGFPLTPFLLIDHEGNDPMVKLLRDYSRNDNDLLDSIYYPLTKEMADWNAALLVQTKNRQFVNRHYEMEYFALLEYIKSEGFQDTNRTGVDTLAVEPMSISHDCRYGAPILTSKYIHLPAVMVELQGFIGGVTSKSWYQTRGCTIWDEWCNGEDRDYIMSCTTIATLVDWADSFDPQGDHEFTANPEFVTQELSECKTLEEAKKKAMFYVDDLGPIYGFQWRNFDGEYYGPQRETMGKSEMENDQLCKLLKTLEVNPNDRRKVVWAWNPKVLDDQALPPCHMGFVVTKVGEKLHIDVLIRSQDFVLGNPFNMVFYYTLLRLLCNEFGYEPGIVKINMSEPHIYVNQLEAVEEQLSRKDFCFNLPNLELPDAKEYGGILNWTAKNVEVKNYMRHPAIKSDVAV